MNPVQFKCNMCGELHNKVLPLSTDLTACHRCGNLIDISSFQKRNRRSNRLNKNSGNNYMFEFDEQDPYNLHELNPNFNNNNNYLDDDFYDFDRYESHDDYLPDPNRRNPNFNNNSNNIRRGDNRPFVRNGQRSNSTGGMFSIQIANDNYDRISAFHHNSNFGYPGINNNSNRNRFRNGNNNINIYRGLGNIVDDFNFEDELNDDLEFMSLMGNNNMQNEIGFLASIINPPPKPKIKLKKIKMCKELYIKNDNGKNEKPTCCICLGVMKLNDDITLLKCQHLFHFKCLDKWVETKEVCPFCRGKIEFAKISKKNKDKKEDEKFENTKINNINLSLNANSGNKNIGVRPVIGERKTNIIRSNNSILNSNNIKKGKKK